jgi:hypothetical protein
LSPLSSRQSGPDMVVPTPSEAYEVNNWLLSYRNTARASAVSAS